MQKLLNITNAKCEPDRKIRDVMERRRRLRYDETSEAGWKKYREICTAVYLLLRTVRRLGRNLSTRASATSQNVLH